MPAAIPAAIVAGGAIIGSVIQKKGAESAADAQRAAAAYSTAEQARQYDLTRSDQLALLDRQRTDQAPWLEAGRAALPQLSAMAGQAIPGDYHKFTLADYQADPGYAFRLQQGQRGIENSAAARGGLYSGATLKALARFNQDTASQEYGNAYNRFTNDQAAEFNRQNVGQTNTFNRLASLAGIGQTAANQVSNAGTQAFGQIAQAGANASNNISSNIIGAGNARASGYVGGANALTNGISQGMNYYQNDRLLQTLSRGNLGSYSSAPGYMESTPRTNADEAANLDAYGI